MADNRIMVTGAKGYIGSRFIKKYSGQYIFNPVSLSSGNHVDFENVFVVLHLSALAQQTKKLPDDQYFTVNTEQTIALAKKAKKHGVKHFIFYSTVAVYGVHGYLNGQIDLLNEQSICNPTSAYAKSKLDAEKALFNLEDNQFKVAVIRPPIVYGRESPGNMAKLKKLIKLFPVLPFNYKNNKRSMVNINNLLYFTKLVIEKEVTGILIPQDEDKYSIKQIVKVLSKGMNKKIYLIKLPKPVLGFLAKVKPQIITSLYGTLLFDSAVSNKKTGYLEQVTTEQGLLSM